MKALLGMDDSVLHVRLLTQEPLANSQCLKLEVTQEQYLALCGYINSSLKIQQGSGKAIRPLSVTSRDEFFLSVTPYHLFRTCNVWVTEALRAAHCVPGFWTPFSSGVLVGLKP